jgi:hypothetical protein
MDPVSVCACCRLLVWPCPCARRPRVTAGGREEACLHDLDFSISRSLSTILRQNGPPQVSAVVRDVVSSPLVHFAYTGLSMGRHDSAKQVYTGVIPVNKTSLTHQNSFD